MGVVAGRVWTWTRGRAVFHPQMLSGPGLKGFFSSHFLMERQKKTFTNVKAKKKAFINGKANGSPFPFEEWPMERLLAMVTGSLTLNCFSPSLKFFFC